VPTTFGKSSFELSRAIDIDRSLRPSDEDKDEDKVLKLYISAQRCEQESDVCSLCHAMRHGRHVATAHTHRQAGMQADDASSDDD
jgi:hypothetical protein